MCPYEILEIPTNATPDEIAKAYRKAAKKHHPDHGGDPERFKAAREAYDILSDDERRRNYDETGDTEERSKHNVAESIIAPMLAEAFAQEQRDAIRHINERLDARRCDHQDRLADTINGIEKLQRKIAKFRLQNEKTTNTVARDFIAEALTSGLTELERAKEGHEQEIQMVTEAMAYLNDLTFRPESMAPRYSNGWDGSLSSYTYSRVHRPNYWD